MKFPLVTKNGKMAILSTGADLRLFLLQIRFIEILYPSLLNYNSVQNLTVLIFKVYFFKFTHLIFQSKSTGGTAEGG